MMDTFGCRTKLAVGDEKVEIYSLPALEAHGYSMTRLPFSLRILLENLLRHEDGETVTREDIEALLRWNPHAAPSREIAFRPARVLMQDFTGVPALVDLAALRDAMRRLGGDPSRINPLLPTELVIDHSVQVDAYGTPEALRTNVEKEYQRNRERYTFLRWGQQAFDGFRAVPPSTGIVHQVNLEHLARVVMRSGGNGTPVAYPDTLVGTDSHTTMINGLGVLGWGVGGIEAEAAMLGQPVTMLVPQVVGFRLTGELAPGATATDLVLTVTQVLRAHGVVGKFVEYFGPGLSTLPLADRATLANMSPEYGATCGIFPVDEETLRFLKLSGRSPATLALVEAYARAQGLFHHEGTSQPDYTDVLELDLSTVRPSLAGPRRPQDRIPLPEMRGAFDSFLSRSGALHATVETRVDGEFATLTHGAVVIAAITSCTNTSNPSVMLAAGLLARNARRKGLRSRPWVKTSLAPGSQVVTEYLRSSGLLEDLEYQGFHVVGYGCTTCIGNSGPLPETVKNAVRSGGLVVASVLSGNRNFEGRISPDVRANYLASPPLVVAFALAGRVDVNLEKEPLGQAPDGTNVFLSDIWPSAQEVAELREQHIPEGLFERVYSSALVGDEAWRSLPAPQGEVYAWDPDSTYVKHPPFFEDLTEEPTPPTDLRGARVLAVLGDSITTDHISPAGSIKPDSPAGQHLISLGVPPEDFNSYGSRRGNHEVMMRGTFANVRLRNQLAPGTEGGLTTHQPDGDQMTIYDAAMRYAREGVPLLVLAGKEYGSGSSRDWAAKGPALLGVRCVIAESYERIHRSNLIGMGVLPLQFASGESVASLGLTGRELYTVTGMDALLADPFEGGRTMQVTARRRDDREVTFQATARLDSSKERDYFQHGGILQYVLRRLLRS